jgi:import receptor subunit TOM70
MPPPPAGYPINVPVGAGNVDVDINAPGVVDRLQDFVTAHKRAVLLGAAAVVASAGVAYYVASSSRPGSGSGSRSLSGGDLEKSAADKKKSSKGKKRKSTKDADGPLLEEISAPTSKAGSDDEGQYTCV